MSIYCAQCGHQNTDTAKFCKGCGTEIDNLEQSQPVTSLNTGMVLEDRYEIKRLIKTGGMGSVYECYDNKFKVTCAVKEMLSQPDERKKQYFIDRFTEEARILHCLRHKNLPVVTNYFVIQERYYLVMDYIKGKDLETILTGYNEGIPENLVIEWAKEILEALEYLHNQKPPIIYRDLKPANVMLREEDNRILLIDFGIARVVNPESETVKTGVGTPAFSAIEVFQGKPEPRSDIYSLGVTLHCLLTGVTPEPFTPLKPVRTYNPLVSMEMDNIVMKASQMKASERYENAGEMRRALEDIGKKPVSPEETLQKIERGNSLSPQILTPSIDIVPPHIPSGLISDNKDKKVIPLPSFSIIALLILGMLFLLVFGKIAISGVKRLMAENVSSLSTPTYIPKIETVKPVLTIIPNQTTSISIPTPNQTTSISIPTPNQTTSISIPTPVSVEQTEEIFYPTMLPINGGTFDMGSNNGKPDEKPVHSVTLSGYYIGKYVITNREFINFLNEMGNEAEGGTRWVAFSKEESEYYLEPCSGITENGSKYSVKNGFEAHPVLYVTWYGAVAYCNWLSEKNGLEKCYGEKGNRGNGDIKKKGYRLPTEAEWEYACRAGSKTQYYWGDNMDDNYCWYVKNARCQVQPVGLRRPNGFGLYDISGNVQEWCSDYYGLYPSYGETDPIGPSGGKNRVIKGGSCWRFEEDCRSSRRTEWPPNLGYYYLSFRIVRTY